jgi:hypothetical protein
MSLLLCPFFSSHSYAESASSLFLKSAVSACGSTAVAVE